MEFNTQLSPYSWSIFRRIMDFLFPHIEERIEGKLFVSGEGTLEFALKHQPDHVFVYFDDECDPIPCVPCQPGAEDTLSWRIIHHHKHHILLIEWKVNSMRKIVWKVR